MKSNYKVAIALVAGTALGAAAVAAYNSPAYKEARTIGNKYATFRLYAVEGLTQ